MEHRNTTPATPADADPQRPGPQVRRLVRSALKGALATLETGSGHPYVSLVTLATDLGGSPILLLSGLARHSRNLATDSRASLLLDGTDGHGDPLAGGRATLVGCMAPIDDPAAARRFSARHPSAAGYAAFADFRFWRLLVERAHWIGGFGRIVEITGADVVEPVAVDDPWREGEARVLETLPPGVGDHLAHGFQIAGAEAAVRWRVTGLDRDGIDIVGSDGALRLEWPAPVATPEQAEATILAMMRTGRPGGSS